MKIKYKLNEKNEVVPIKENEQYDGIVFKTLKEAMFYTKYIIPSIYAGYKMKKYNYQGFKSLYINMMLFKKSEKKFQEIKELTSQFNYLESKEFEERLSLINEMEKLKNQKIILLYKYRKKVVNFLNKEYNLKLSIFDKDVYNFLANQINYKGIKKYYDSIEKFQCEFLGKIHLIEEKESNNSGKYIKLVEENKENSIRENADKNSLFKYLKDYTERKRKYIINHYVCQYYIISDEFIEELGNQFNKIKYNNELEIYNLIGAYGTTVEVITQIENLGDEYLLIGHKGATFPENSQFYLIKQFEGEYVEI